MTFWLLHLVVAFGVGLVVALFLWSLLGDPFWGIVFLTGLVASQFIDLDHYQGRTQQLFDGAKATSNEDYARIYSHDPIRFMHTKFFLYFTTVSGVSLIIGLWLHFGMDGLV